MDIKFIKVGGESWGSILKDLKLHREILKNIWKKKKEKSRTSFFDLLSEVDTLHYDPHTRNVSYKNIIIGFDNTTY